MRLVFVSEDFDRCSDDIDVVEFIFVSSSCFTPDYTVWVLMILLMLIIRRRGVLNSILLEDVLLFIHFSICWPSWSRGYIVIVSWLGLDYFSYSVIEIELLWEWFSLILVMILPVQSFMASYWSTWLIGDLEGGHVDDFEYLS